MTRAISIVLVARIGLQTVGCSTWRPLARANAVAEDDSQSSSSIRDQIQWKLKEGMHVRIRIRAGTNAPIKGQVIECIIKEIGQASLTLTPVDDYIRSTVKREFTLHYADIMSIEYRKSDHEPNEYVVYLVTTAILCLIILYSGLSQAQLD